MNYLSKIPEGSAVLVIGPPLSKKDRILYDFASQVLKNKKSVLFVSMDHFPKDIEASLKKNKVLIKECEKRGDLRFIDGYSAQTQNKISDTNVIKRVSGPLALNEVSVALAELENKFYRAKKKQYIFFQSLSTLLIYSTIEAIERFLQVIIARAKSVNGSIILTMEEGMHDAKAVAGVEHLVDGVIRVKGSKISLKI